MELCTPSLITGQNKGNGKWRKWPFPLFATILSPYSPLFHVYIKGLSSHVVQGKAKGVRRKREFGSEAVRGKRETSQGSTACGKSPGLPVPTGTFWTLDTTLLFPPSSKRKTDVLSLCSPT